MEHTGEGRLLERVDVIEAQPLEQRAASFDQLADELLAELERSDRESPAGGANSGSPNAGGANSGGANAGGPNTGGANTDGVSAGG